MNAGLIPPAHSISVHECECYLCGTWLRVRSNGNGSKARRSRYSYHLLQVHSGDLSDRARSVVADAMLRHERKVGVV